MAYLWGALQSTITEAYKTANKYAKAKWLEITATVLNEGLTTERRALDVVQRDEDGNVVGGSDNPQKVNITDIDEDAVFNMENYEAHVFLNAVAANGNGTAYTVGGMKTMTVSITGASVSTSTITFQGGDADANYTSITAVRLSDLATATSTSTVASATGEKWQLPIEGLTTVRCVLSALTGEGATVTVKGVAVG